MSQLVTVKLAKPQGASWGFRLQGGKDFATPLCIQKVNAGSVAEKTGLQAGDAIVSIGGLDALAMRHKEAQDAIIKAGGNFDMVVQRGAQTWKPAVTPLAQPQQTPQGPVATKTSLHADKQINGKTIVNAQYNTPLNLYSEDSIAETLSAQAEVLGKGVLGINFKKYKKEEKILTDSPTYKLIHGLEEDSTRLPSRALQADDGIAQQTKTSFPVVRMAREQGYYNINEKLYCDVHAKQAARHNPPAPNMEPVAVKPGAMPPAGAVPSSQVKAPTPTRIQVPTSEPPAPAPVPKPTPPPPAAPEYVPEPAPAPAPQPEPVQEVVQEAPAPPPVQSQPLPEPTLAPIITPASVVTPPQSAPKVFKPAPAPAPAPLQQRTIANQAGFGAPAGDIDVRAHIPKKAPTGGIPASVFEPAPSMMPAPVQSFGSAQMPKPAPMPGMGKMPGSGPANRELAMQPGQRTAPRRGRGVMNQSSVRVPICATCQRQIRGPFVSALGKSWCPDHFICAMENCRKPLLDMGFVEEQGALNCEDCYEKFLAPICGKCDKRIKGDCLNAVGKQFHPECFCCAYCGGVFGSGAFYLEDGLPYCENDWNELFTTKCVGCNFPIEAGDRWVEALNNNYHSQCFKCSTCQKNLEGQSFFAKGGKPYCKAHAARRGL